MSTMSERIISLSNGGTPGLQAIRCSNCSKILLEATGEVKKICPKCKTENHVVVTSKGIINLK